MDTTIEDLPQILAEIARRIDLAETLQTEQSKAENNDQIDWLYSRALWHGLTPDGITLALGVEVV